MFPLFYLFMVNEFSDVELWRNFKNGDVKSLDHIARLYYLSLFQYGLSKGYSRELVEDSIQDLFITLWDSRQSLSQVSHVKSYLFLALRHRLNRTNLNNQRQKTWLDKIFSSSISFSIADDETNAAPKPRLTAVLIPSIEFNCILLHFLNSMQVQS